MTNEERVIQRKLRMLQHAEKIGNPEKPHHLSFDKHKPINDSLSD